MIPCAFWRSNWCSAEGQLEGLWTGSRGLARSLVHQSMPEMRTAGAHTGGEDRRVNLKDNTREW